MKRGYRRLLIAAGVVAAVVIVASVVLRLVLTKERLTAMLVPRIERAVGAEIEIEDIAVRFPFGFGVSMRGLSFARPAPGGGAIVFAAEDLGVDVSLLSLIRRRPRIESVRVDGGSLDIDPGGGRPSIGFERIEARLSMTPADTVYLLDPRFSAEAVSVGTAGPDSVVRLPGIRFSGQVETSRDFQRVTVADGELSVAGLAAFDVEGSARDLAGRREFTAEIGAERLDAAALLAAILAIDLSGLRAGMTPERLREAVPVAVDGGTVGLDVTASGSAAAPSTLELAGSVRLEGLSLRAPALDLPLRTGGTVRFSMGRVASDDIVVEAGRSRVEASFDLPLEGMPPSPGAAGFSASAKIDIGEAAAAAGSGGPVPTGALEAAVRGSAHPRILADLFPRDPATTDPAAIRRAWSELRLEGDLTVTGLEPPPSGAPAGPSGIDATAAISGGDVTGLVASWRLGGSPWKATGDLKGVLPAMAELMLVTGGDDPPGTPGEALDRLTTRPEISLSIEGRSFDARPFQDAAKESAEAGTETAKPGGEGPAVNPLVSNPVTLLMLKNSSVSVSIDSVIARKAVLTDLDAKGRAVDGRLSAGPVTLAYAGGRGSGTVAADLRDPSRIPAEVDLDFTGVQAGKALEPFHGIGGLLSGVFSFSIEGSLAAGPEADPLESLTVSGTASSTQGQIDISRFTAPLKASGISLPFAEQFAFRQWTQAFAIDDGRVTVDRWRIASNNGDWDITGSFGFDGTLDYDATLVLTPEMQSTMKDLSKYRDLAELFRDESGNLVFEFDIGGTATSPTMMLDQTRATRKAGEKLIEGAQKKLLDLLKKK